MAGEANGLSTGETDRWMSLSAHDPYIGNLLGTSCPA